MINRLLVAQAKDTPCADCGEDFPAEAMDFDHVRGVKVANVSDLMACHPSLVEAEIAKCEVVCANCHRLRTQTRRLDAHVDEAEAYDVLVAMFDW